MPTFADLHLSNYLQKSLHQFGYEQPTPIQQQAIPLALAGKDVVGQAQTGSGKTAAYGLSILQKIDVTQKHVQSLIIVPTRELALQVRDELKKLGKYLQNLKILAVYGGHSFIEEQHSFTHPPQVLIATPGRLLDHLTRATFDLKELCQLVIDEADKLLELRFEEELNQILTFLPTSRQTLLFSATLPDPVLSLISKSLVHPQFVKTDDRANPAQIEFIAYRVESTKKLPALLLVLSQLKQERIVLFCNTRERVDEVSNFLKKKNFLVEALHGGMDQLNRDKALMKFRNGSSQLLVATDLASRGIHINELGIVIHLEIVREETSFLHRSGRTGRVGQEGKVYLLLSPDEEKYIQQWQQLINLQWKELDFQTTSQTKVLETRPLALPEFVTLHIKAGKKEKLSPRDIVGALIAGANLKAQDIGKIEIHDHFSYVAVPYTQGKHIADLLNESKIKGKKIKVSLIK